MRRTLFIYTALLLAGLCTSARAQTAPLTLAQCIDSVLAYNATLQNAALEIQMASEQKKEAFTKYFPQISANVMAMRAFKDLIKGEYSLPQEIAMLGPTMAALAATPISISELNGIYSANVVLMQPIFTGGQIYTGNKLASLQKEVMTMQLQMKQKDIISSITEEYWQIASLRYKLTTLEAADTQLSEVMKDVENYVNAGVASSNDLLKVKLQQQKLASGRVKISNALRVLMLLMAQQCGMAGKEVEIVTPSAEELLAQLNSEPVATIATGNPRQRIECQLAQQNVEAQKYMLQMERAKLMPTIAVGVAGFHANIGGLSETMERFINPRINNGMVLGTVSIPLSAWWGGAHAMKRMRLKVQQAQIDLKDAEEKLNIDLQASHIAVMEAAQQIEIAQTSVESATENLRIASESYRAGVTPLSDLLDATTLHQTAQSDLASAIADYYAAKSKYELKLRTSTIDN